MRKYLPYNMITVFALFTLLTSCALVNHNSERKLSSIDEEKEIYNNVSRVVNSCDGVLDASARMQKRAYYITLVPQVVAGASGTVISLIGGGYAGLATHNPIITAGVTTSTIGISVLAIYGMGKLRDRLVGSYDLDKLRSLAFEVYSGEHGLLISELVENCQAVNESSDSADRIDCEEIPSFLKSVFDSNHPCENIEHFKNRFKGDI